MAHPDVRTSTLHLDYTTEGLRKARAELVAAIEARPFDVPVIEACAQAIASIDRAIAWQAENGEPKSWHGVVA